MSFILLTGAASAAAYKAKSIFNSANLMLGDYEPLPSLPSLRVLPSPSSATYIHDFLTFCLAEEIAEVYPIRRQEVLALLSAHALLAEYGIRLVLPPIIAVAQVPAFEAANCRHLEVRTEGLYWQSELSTQLFLCD